MSDVRWVKELESVGFGKTTSALDPIEEESLSLHVASQVSMLHRLVHSVDVELLRIVACHKETLDLAKLDEDFGLDLHIETRLKFCFYLQLRILNLFKRISRFLCLHL